MQEKNKGLYIFVLVVSIVVYMAMFMFMRNESLRVYNGVMAQIQVAASTVMVTTNMKRGFIVACVVNVINEISSFMGYMHTHRTETLPGLVIPIITIATMAVIYVYLSRSIQSQQELNEQYEQLMDSNRVIQEKNDALKTITYTDRMTGIANRQFFVEQVEEAIRLNMPITIIYADIDNFKYINDTLGPKTGDAALASYAERVSNYCGRKYKCARVAGDEFGILLTGEQTEADVLNIVEQLRKMFRDPINVLGAPVAVTMSYGIVAFPRDGSDAEILMDNAIMAVYNAKANGKDRPCFFSPSN